MFGVPELKKAIEAKKTWDESNPLWPNPMWLKDPEDLHQNQLQDHQNHPQDHQNRLQGLQNHTYKEPPRGGECLFGVVLMVLEVILVFLGVVLVVLELVLVLRRPS